MAQLELLALSDLIDVFNKSLPDEPQTAIKDEPMVNPVASEIGE